MALQGLIRSTGLRGLAHFNPGDIRIWHPYYPRKVLLHSFHHKGYWYYRERRELETSKRYAQLIRPNASVVEVGGHIGMHTLHFAALTPRGRVTSFEPGSNNLRYFLHNCAGIPNVDVRTQALSDFDGAAVLFEDNLTGQNNSLVSWGASLARVNAASASFSHLAITEHEVSVTTMDQAVGFPVDFIKIDVEGGEVGVLRGAQRVLESDRPSLMVEVAKPSQGEVWEILVDGLGYIATTPDGREHENRASVDGNTFFVAR